MENSNEIWRGVQFWTDEIEKAGLKDKIPAFNDVITGKNAPVQTKDNLPLEPVVRDVKLGGKTVDIYHWGGASHRLYLHIKD